MLQNEIHSCDGIGERENTYTLMKATEVRRAILLNIVNNRRLIVGVINISKVFEGEV